MPRLHRVVPVFWKTELPVDYIDTSLVINTWETVVANLSGGKPARLLYIIIEQTNNGATAETIEFEITINGTTYTKTMTGMGSGTPVYLYFQKDLVAGDLVLLHTTTAFSVGCFALNTGVPVPFNVETVGLIRVRQTTDVDAVSAQIEVNIIWEKLTAGR